MYTQYGLVFSYPAQNKSFNQEIHSPWWNNATPKRIAVAVRLCLVFFRTLGLLYGKSRRDEWATLDWVSSSGNSFFRRVARQSVLEAALRIAETRAKGETKGTSRRCDETSTPGSLTGSL